MMRKTLILALIGAAAAFSPAMPATLARRGAAQPLCALRMEQGASSVHQERRRALQVCNCGGCLLCSWLPYTVVCRDGPVVDSPVLARSRYQFSSQGSVLLISHSRSSNPARNRSLRLIDSCITQLKAQGPSRTCNESKEEEDGTALFAPLNGPCSPR